MGDRLSRIITRNGDAGTTGLSDLLFVLAPALNRAEGSPGVLRQDDRSRCAGG